MRLAPPRARLGIALLAACTSLAACNGSEEEGDPAPPPRSPDQAEGREARDNPGETVRKARRRLSQAAKTARALRSPDRARRLHARVEEIISGGALEARELDDFGLAALGELGLAVPSLVETDADGVAVALDRAAVPAFRRHALSDPSRALLGPATDEVEAIERALRDAEPDPETRAGLRESARDIRAFWPELADRLEAVAAP